MKLNVTKNSQFCEKLHLSFFFFYSHIPLSGVITSFTVSVQRILGEGIMPIYQKSLEKDSCLDFSDPLFQKGLDIFNNFFVNIRPKPRLTLALKPLCILLMRLVCSFKNVPKKLSHCFWWISMLM